MPEDLAWSEETRRETKRLMLLIFDKSEASVSWRDLSTKYLRLKKKRHTHIKEQQQKTNFCREHYVVFPLWQFLNHSSSLHP